jgi:hypothetical protein
MLEELTAFGDVGRDFDKILNDTKMQVQKLADFVVNNKLYDPENDTFHPWLETFLSDDSKKEMRTAMGAVKMANITPVKTEIKAIG